MMIVLCVAMMAQSLLTNSVAGQRDTDQRFPLNFKCFTTKAPAIGKRKSA
jgi:hypothetical protein